MNNKQKEIYEFIVSYIEKNMYPPSIREIAAGVGFRSNASVWHHLLKIQEYGFIEIKMNSPRAIKVKGYKFVKEIQK